MSPWLQCLVYYDKIRDIHQLLLFFQFQFLVIQALITFSMVFMNHFNWPSDCGHLGVIF